MLTRARAVTTALIVWVVLSGSVPAAAQTANREVTAGSRASAHCSATVSTTTSREGSNVSVTVSSQVRSSSSVTLNGSGAIRSEASSSCSASANTDVEGGDARCSATAEARVNGVEERAEDNDGVRCSAEATVESGSLDPAHIRSLLAGWLE